MSRNMTVEEAKERQRLINVVITAEERVVIAQEELDYAKLHARRDMHELRAYLRTILSKY